MGLRRPKSHNVWPDCRTTYVVTSSSQCAGGTLKTVNYLKIVMINQGEMNLKNGPGHFSGRFFEIVEAKPG